MINCNWKFPAEQFVSNQYHVPFSHISAVQVLGAKDDGNDKRLGDGQIARPVWETAKDTLQFGQGSRDSGFFFTEKPDANVWVDGAVSSYHHETCAEAKQRLGEVRTLHLAGRSNISPTLSWLNGTATLRVWHPYDPDQAEVRTFCITDKAASDEVKATFENSTTRAFDPAGFLEQDDSENWCEIQKLLKGHRTHNNKLCLKIRLGREKRRDSGIPDIINYIFSETAVRGMCQRWADLLSSESWQKVLDKTAAC